MSQHREHCEHCGMSMAAHTVEGAETFADIAECPRTYYVTSRRGMTPWASGLTMAEAMDESRRARQQGLDGDIVAE